MAKRNQVHHDDESNLKYRSYLLLANQQEEIRRRLSLPLASNSRSSSFGSSSSFTSHEGPPSLSSSPMDSIIIPPRSSYMMFNGPMSPVSTDPLPTLTLQETRSDEDRLLDINRQIKATLTDLLNQPGVRQDPSFFSWVKERLMDAAVERRELRKLKCERRTSPGFAMSGSEDEMDGSRY